MKAWRNDLQILHFECTSMVIRAIEFEISLLLENTLKNRC